MNLIDFFNLVIYIQPFLFLGLLKTKINFDLRYFIFPAASVGLFIFLTNFSIGHYPGFIMAQYILFVILVAWAFRIHGSIWAISFSFLIVFINSYIWEFPIHVLDLITNWNFGLQIIQGLHLIPLPFMLYLTKEDRIPGRARTIAEDLLILWILVLGITWIRFQFQDIIFANISHFIARGFSLYTFIKILNFKNINASV